MRNSWPARLSILALPVLLLTGGCPTDPGDGGDGGADGQQGPPGPAGADGADGVNGQDGANGQNGAPGADGAQGPEGPQGPDGPQGSEGPQGPQGIPGPIDDTPPAAPFNLANFKTTFGPPIFELRWLHDDDAVAVQEFVIYESDEPFSDSADALIAAVVPGLAREALIELRSDSGDRHFRVAAVSFTGVEGDLSDELEIDTTSRLVFIGDKDVDNEQEVFSVIAGSGAEPSAISGTIVANGDVDRLFVSPDGRRAALVADKETDGTVALFVAPLDGSSEPVKVSGTFVTGGVLEPFQVVWSPDGTRLAFIGDKEIDDVRELFVTDADGGSEPVKVSGNMLADGDVDFTDFAWSPDGTRLAFIADKLTDTRNELFVTLADGSREPGRISGSLVAGGQVEAFAWSPDGSKIAMRASKDTVALPEIFVVDPAGITAPVKVSGTLAGFASTNSNPLWSPDSTRLAFSGDLLTDGVFEGFVARADGEGDPLRFTGASQAFSDISTFEWSPDGTQLAFTMDKNTDDAREVFVGTAGGGEEPTRVSGAYALDEEAFGLQWSPTGAYVAWFADPDVADQFEAFVADPGTPDAPVRVSGTPIAGTDVFDLAWSPDGTRLVLVGDLAVNGDTRLFIANPAGGQPVEVSGTFAANGDVNAGFFFWSTLGS